MVVQKVLGLEHSPHSSALLRRVNPSQCTPGCRMDTSAPIRSPPTAPGFRQISLNTAECQHPPSIRGEVIAPSCTGIWSLLESNLLQLSLYTQNWDQYPKAPAREGFSPAGQGLLLWGGKHTKGSAALRYMGRGEEKQRTSLPLPP